MHERRFTTKIDIVFVYRVAKIHYVVWLEMIGRVILIEL